MDTGAYKIRLKKYQAQTQDEIMIVHKLCRKQFQMCCYYPVYFYNTNRKNI